MLPRDRVRQALEFGKPDRVPRDLYTLPAVDMFQKENKGKLLKKYPMDIFKIGPPAFKPGMSKRQEVSSLKPYTVYGLEWPKKGEHYIDEWGSIWSVAEDGVLGEVVKPVLEDLSTLKEFTPPWDFLESTDLSGVDAFCNYSDRFLLSGITARPFERAQFLRGTVNFFKDLMLERDSVSRLLSLIHEYNLEHIKRWLQTKVDGVFLMDDWGAQRNLLISPSVWRELLKPLYREYCDLIHRHGKYVFFHSDGWIEDLFDDIVEIGIDALNSQLFCMDIEKIAQHYKGKITFWGEIDRQQLLPFGTPDEIRKAVYRVRHALDNGCGGVIAQCEWGKNVPIENIEAVYSAWNDPLELIYSAKQHE